MREIPITVVALASVKTLLIPMLGSEGLQLQQPNEPSWRNNLPGILQDFQAKGWCGKGQLAHGSNTKNFKQH